VSIIPIQQKRGGNKGKKFIKLPQKGGRKYRSDGGGRKRGGNSLPEGGRALYGPIVRELPGGRRKKKVDLLTEEEKKESLKLF